MKKICILLFLICSTALCHAQKQYATRNLTVYGGPGEWYNKTGSISKGSAVSIQKKSKDGWLMVTSNRTVGYIKSGNLTSKRPSSGKTTETASNNYGSDSRPLSNSRSSSQLPKPIMTGRKMEGKDIYSKYSSAVFMVFTMDSDERIAQGSGFFINDKGLAVSNNHVFENCTGAAIWLPNENKVLSIEKIYTHQESPDFIIFQVDLEGERSNYIPLCRREPQVGEKVFSITSPKGFSNSFSSGEISGWRDRHFMQISNPIDHGSSGGALINEYGEAVGITTGKIDSSANINFAWSIIPILDELIY